jgi:WD40 repeat protein
VWDSRTGDPVLSLPGTESGVFSPDGGRLVTGDHTGVHVWDTAPLNRAFDMAARTTTAGSQ